MSLSASAVQGEQLYDPYGYHRYAEGTLGTDKGYTGQFIDEATGLAYDHARSYLRHIGVFLSPDRVQSNAQGMDPYAYVGGNPETKTDPTGERMCVEDGDGVTCSKPGDGGGSGGSGGTYCYSGNCNGDPTKTHPNPCAAGPQSFNNCTYHGGDCDGLTFAGCKQRKAYEDAAKAREHFQSFADLFDGKLALMGQLVIQFVLTLLGFFAGPLISLVTGIVGGIVAGLSAPGIIAGDLASVFSGEISKVEADKIAGTTIDYSYFTKANLAADRSQIQNILADDGGMFTTGGAAFSAYTFMNGLLVGGVVGFSKAVLSLMTGGASFGVAFAVTVGVGAAILGQQAQGYLNQEEADLA